MSSLFIAFLIFIGFMLIVAAWGYAWSQVVFYNPAHPIVPEPWTVFPRKGEEE